MKDLTPKSFRCATGMCPSIFQLDDGRLAIIGAMPTHQTMQDVSTADLQTLAARVGVNEQAVLIDPTLLAEIELKNDAIHSDDALENA